MKAFIRVALVAVLLVLFAPGASANTIRHLHEDDYGRTIHVHRWDTIVVRLPNNSGGYHVPRTSDRDVLRRTSVSGGYPSAEDARASFRARHRGTADLTAYTDYACLHTTPRCEIAQREWIVHVVVG